MHQNQANSSQFKQIHGPFARICGANSNLPRSGSGILGFRVKNAVKWAVSLDLGHFILFILFGGHDNLNK